MPVPVPKPGPARPDRFYHPGMAALPSPDAEAPGAFASAVMLRVLVQGMQALGMDTSAAPPLHIGQGPHVQLAAKRALLQSAVAQGGLACLLQLGARARLEGGDPIHHAMAAARGVDDLLARWGRLEQVVHRWHRVRVLQQGERSLVLQHVSLKPGASPRPAENLVVLGLLAALLERQGLHGLRVTIADTTVLPGARERDLQHLAAAGRTGQWSLQWQPASAGPPPVPGALQAEVPPAVAGPAGPFDARTGLSWPAEALQCAGWVQQDLLRRQSLAAAADAVGMARRSLQRVLAQGGLHFSGLVAEVRVRHAAWWLLHTTLPLAEVGFVCGYADQAHFSRAFQCRTGWRPGAYRSGFAAVR
jgi:AraC-like DNA-binding protein